MEMAEEKIAERIDANLLNIPIQDLTDLPKSSFENKVVNLSKKTQGSLIIKEYPTASAHSGHFKALLNELALKKSFRPDIIFIDYLNICASSRYKSGVSVNSYSHIKAVAEEARGLASRSPRSLSYLPPRPLVLVIMALMLTLLILVSPLGCLLLLILCLPLLALRNLNNLVR